MKAVMFAFSLWLMGLVVGVCVGFVVAMRLFH